MLNKATLIGRLGGDPEPRSINNGIVVNFSLATTRRYTANGEKREETEWHRIVMFGKLAEIAEQWLNKGSLVYIEGRIQTRKWQDKQGVERYNTEIIAEQMQMLGGNNNAQQTRSNNSQSGYNNNSRQQTNRQSTPQNRQPEPEPETVDFNDDIPF